jgi:bacillithiol system protein YtxJ
MKETVLHDVASFELALQQPLVMLFKHSPTCAISTAARQQYEAFRRQHPDAPTIFVDVIAAGATARGIAERTGVRHESPQAILFDRGRVVWHASHEGVTAAALAGAWARAQKPA